MRRYARIVTVDPETRRVEGIIGDRTPVEIEVREVSTLFRWPSIGEVWSISQNQGGFWHLEARLDETPVHSIEELGSGDARIDAERVYDAQGNLLTTQGDLDALIPKSLAVTVNVKWFGAIGDGSTDDTTAIQAAIASMGAGGVVFFPPGTYVISAALTLNNGHTLRGVGPQQSRIRLKGGAPAGTHLVRNAGGDTNINYYCRVEDLHLDGNKANNASGGDGIRGCFTQSQFRNVWVTDCAGRGIFLYNASSASGPWVLNRLERVFASNNGATTDAVRLNNGDSSVITESWFAGPSGSTGNGLYLWACSNMFTSDLLLDSVAVGIFCEFVQWSNFHGITAENVSTRAVGLRNANNDHVWSGLLFNANGQSGGANSAFHLDTFGGNAIKNISISNVRAFTSAAGNKWSWVVNTNGGATLTRVTTADIAADPDAVTQAALVNLPSTLLAEHQGAVYARTGANRVSQGSGAPSKPGGKDPVAGDYYLRVDTPSTAGQRIYVCTTGGASPAWASVA